MTEHICNFCIPYKHSVQSCRYVEIAIKNKKNGYNIYNHKSQQSNLSEQRRFNFDILDFSLSWKNLVKFISSYQNIQYLYAEIFIREPFEAYSL
jgi:hypothetical protein